MTVLVALLAFGIGVATGLAVRRVRARSRAGRIGPPDRRQTAPPLDQSGAERAALAHQLRNPLGSIRIAIEMLRQPDHDEGGESAPDASGWVHEVGWAQETIAANVDQMAEIIDRNLQAGPTPGTARPAIAGGGRPVVLIADDDVAAAEALRRLLVLRRYRVAVVHDGRAAVDTARCLQPDVALVDIDLPIFSGLQVARSLRARRDPGPRLLVAITGRHGDEDRRLSAEAGFDHHLVKPIDLAALESLLISVVGSPPRS